jgi:hypothetical protein
VANQLATSFAPVYQQPAYAPAYQPTMATNAYGQPITAPAYQNQMAQSLVAPGYQNYGQAFAQPIYQPQ